MSAELQYGVHNGKIVCISDLNESQRGLKCNCTCPYCSQPLQAKLGNQRQHHFAHDNHLCNIESAQQTALHMLAKEIILEERKISLPALIIERSEATGSAEFLYADYPSEMEYLKSCVASCSHVSLEKRISDLIPDIIVTINGRQCLIEIAVTHFIDEEKQNKIIQLGLPTIEIDLSRFPHSLPDRSEIKNILLNDSKYKKWIYNPRHKEALQWAQEQYELLLSADEIEREKEEAKEEAEKIKQREKRVHTTRQLQQLFIPSNYKQALISLRNDAASFKALSQSHFAKESNGHIPFFLDIPITGEMIFPCDRRVWQIKIFDHFIYSRSKQSGDHVISIKRIQSWLRRYQTDIPIDWGLASKASAICNDEQYRTFLLFNDVLLYYLKYLQKLGFISYMFDGQANVLVSHTLIPPDQNTAQEFLNLLKHIDQFEPNVDRLLSARLTQKRIASIATPPNFDSITDEPFVPHEKHIKGENCEKCAAPSIIKNANYDSDDFILDPYDPKLRWLKCVKCGEVFPQYDFPISGGEYGVNKGICRNCMRRKHD